MVMECGEIDLAHMLKRQKGDINENFICMYWQQMLQVQLEHQHSLHSPPRAVTSARCRQCMRFTRRA